MKTEQIMERSFMGSIVRQNHKNGFFNATDLVKIGNEYRRNKGLSNKDLFQYFKTSETKEFIEIIMKKEETVHLKEVRKGSKGGTWVHPLIIIDIAMWLNPDFKYQALKWLEDSLIESRDNSGDSYKKMSSALYENYDYNKIHFKIKEVAKRIKQVVGVSDWNSATEEQLNNRDKIHNNIIYGCKLGLDIKKVIRTAIEDVYPNYLENL